jgi:hypothetical protein
VTAEERYQEEMGREPPALPEEDPLAWQYRYRGTPEERERLRLEMLGLDPEPDVHPDQAALL